MGECRVLRKWTNLVEESRDWHLRALKPLINHVFGKPTLGFSLSLVLQALVFFFFGAKGTSAVVVFEVKGKMVVQKAHKNSNKIENFSSQKYFWNAHILRSPQLNFMSRKHRSMTTIYQFRRFLTTYENHLTSLKIIYE